MKRLLFLCTGNSCRSQMAEGFARAWGKNEFEVESAGTHPSTLHPLAVKAMKELDINIADQYSKSVLQFKDQHFDVLVTVCDHAKASCPAFGRAEVKIHHSFPDPVSSSGDEEERMVLFRKVRDEIGVFVKDLIAHESH
jgi:arsenate reductase (thioredoxin)